MLGWLVCAAAVGALTYVLVVLFWGRSTEPGTSINDFILPDSGEDGEDCCFHYDQPPRTAWTQTTSHRL